MKMQGALILIFLFPIACYAQHSPTEFGIRIGTSLSNSQITKVDRTYDQGEKMKVGLLFGGFVNLATGRNLIIQPGLQYVSKGWRENYSYGSYNEPINYIEVPLNILCKLRPVPQHFYLGTGISPAFQIGRRWGFPVKKFDVGINVLAGYTLPIGFSVNLGYTYGLLNVNGDKTYINKIQNRYLGISAGYVF